MNLEPDHDVDPVGMTCPGCGNPPALAFPTQAWCGTDDCKIVTWNPTMTLDELLDDFGTVDLGPLDSLVRDEPPPPQPKPDAGAE